MESTVSPIVSCGANFEHEESPRSPAPCDQPMQDLDERQMPHTAKRKLILSPDVARSRHHKSEQAPAKGRMPIYYGGNSTVLQSPREKFHIILDNVPTKDTAKVRKRPQASQREKHTGPKASRVATGALGSQDGALAEMQSPLKAPGVMSWKTVVGTKNPKPDGRSNTIYKPKQTFVNERQAFVFEDVEAFKAAESWLKSIPDAPTYTPSEEEWAEPSSYISMIEEEASKYGICVIQPPVSATVRACRTAAAFQAVDLVVEKQSLAELLKGRSSKDVSKKDSNQGSTYMGIEKYKELAELNANRLFGTADAMPVRTVEAAYWLQCEVGSPVGSDHVNGIEGSAFDSKDLLGDTAWNLNSFARCSGSLLRWIPWNIAGVTTPVLFVGMAFTTAPWQLKDHFLSTIYYNHVGGQKLWYSIPASEAAKFEAVAGNTVYLGLWEKLASSGKSPAQCADAIASALMQNCTMFSPKILIERGVKTYRVVQPAGSFVVVFPRCYHSGINTGFSVSEAIQFAMTSKWISFGYDARRLYRRIHRESLVPYEFVLLCEAHQLSEKLQAATMQAQEPRLLQLIDESKPLISAFMKVFETFKSKIELLSALGAVKRVVKAAFLPKCPLDLQDSMNKTALLCCANCKTYCYLSSVLLNRKMSSECKLPKKMDVCLECVASKCNHWSSSDQRTGSVDTNKAKGVVVFVKETWSQVEDIYDFFKTCLALQDGKKDCVSVLHNEAVGAHGTAGQRTGEVLCDGAKHANGSSPVKARKALEKRYGQERRDEGHRGALLLAGATVDGTRCVAKPSGSATRDLDSTDYHDQRGNTTSGGHKVDEEDCLKDAAVPSGKVAPAKNKVASLPMSPRKSFHPLPPLNNWQD